ncbi:Transcription factor [Zalaria obscura]|uniref:Transcription factor n=1 Tax=Zalaria obscura TaxID=2024903 RepID=A0ACC3S654_9PEZI
MTSEDVKWKASNVETPKESEQATPDKNGVKDEQASAGADSPPKKRRRKVNHACVYCRRSHMTCDLERPCARCVKRDIGHLCHDEPREPNKRTRSEGVEIAPADEAPSRQNTAPVEFNTYEQDDGGLNIGPPQGPQGRMDAPQLVQPKPVSPVQLGKQAKNEQFNMGFGNDWNFGGNNANQFQDMHNLHPNYMFNTSEVTNEYNLLNDFLSTSLLDDGAMWNGDEAQALYSDPLLAASSIGNYANNIASLTNNNNPGALLTGAPSQAAAGNEISRPSSAFPIDSKARDKFYMTAADPAGNDTPEERMNKLLKAKYDAGMLRPFNYVKGYARLNQYMERNLQPQSRQKILRQLDKFRPKFREAMHKLTDIQLVLGKLAIHEIIVEDSLVSYWEKFGAIAFDQSQKAILTSCSLKNPDPNSKDPMIKCCFSFTIRRDTHNM